MASQLFTDEHAGFIPRQVAPNIWLIEADVALLDVDDMELDVVTNLGKALDRFNDEFDLCLIDTPPNLQRRMIAALAASDSVVTPFNISAFTLARMPKLMATIETVQDQYNPDLRFLGFLPNLINSRSTEELRSCRAFARNTATPCSTNKSPTAPASTNLWQQAILCGVKLAAGVSGMRERK